MTTREFIVDADGHVCEPADLWEPGLPVTSPTSGIRLRWNEQTGFDECMLEDRMVTDRGLVGLGNAGRDASRTSGAAATTRTCNPAGFDAAGAGEGARLRRASTSP